MPNILMEASSVGFIKDLVRRGAGIGILGMMSVEGDVRRGTLKAIPLSGAGLMVYIDLLLPREGYRPVAAQAFLRFLLGEDHQGAEAGSLTANASGGLPRGGG